MAEGQARSFPRGQTTRSCVSAKQPSRARLAAKAGAGEGRRDPSHHSSHLLLSHPHQPSPLGTPELHAQLIPSQGREGTLLFV